MPGMNVLFAGLVAFGVAVSVVVLIKCLCFIGEFLNARHTERAVAALQVQPTTVTSSAQALSSSSNGYSARRLSDRIYAICVEPPTSNNKSTSPAHDSPPSYDDAVRLIGQQPVESQNQ